MATIHSNLKLYGDFAECESAVERINTNFKTLDDLVLKGIQGVVSSLPSSPVEGEAVILDSDNMVYIYSDGAWTSYAPNLGWRFIDATDLSMQVFDGTDWHKVILPIAPATFIFGAGNLGAGEQVFKQVNFGIAEFKTLIEGAGIKLESDPDTITISILEETHTVSLVAGSLYTLNLNDIVEVRSFFAFDTSDNYVELGYTAGSGSLIIESDLTGDFVIKVRGHDV